MRETVRSLRWYFGLAGTFGVAGNLAFARATLVEANFGELFDWFFRLAVYTLTLYAAFTLPKLLRTQLRPMLAVVVLNQIRCVVAIVIALFGPSPISAIGFALGFVVLRYIERNLKRLAASSARRTCSECGAASADWRDTCECGHRFAPASAA
jgi:hypothetical protein